MKKIAYTIELSYNNYDTDFDRRVENSVGRDIDGSGCGFGRRDLVFYFYESEYDKAKETYNKLRRFKKYSSKVRTYCAVCGKISNKLKQYCSIKCQNEEE